jgi:hypothetical protein
VREQECISNKPVKPPVCQSDEGRFCLSETGVPTHKKYGLKWVFSLSGCFLGILTLQYSGLPAASFLGGYFWAYLEISRLPAPVTTLFLIVGECYFTLASSTIAISSAVNP